MPTTSSVLFATLNPSESIPKETTDGESTKELRGRTFAGRPLST